MSPSRRQGSGSGGHPVAVAPSAGPIGVAAVAVLMMAAGLAAGCATRPAAAPRGAPRAAATTTADFCSEAQRVVANSRVPAVNTVHADRQAFVLSKASARPLETRQYASPRPVPAARRRWSPAR